MINEVLEEYKITKEQLNQICSIYDCYCEPTCFLILTDINNGHMFTWRSQRGNWYKQKRDLTKYLKMAFDFKDSFYTSINKSNRLLKIFLLMGWKQIDEQQDSVILELSKEDFKYVWCK